ncbi:MAG: hypothetical protein IKZ85_08990 [Pseudobutyrivibrio sp.]|nr:hypothetical protein [Pseudobutyrivibrio sp.]
MLFNKFKKIDNNKWGEAYKSSPNVYGKTDVELLKESYYSFTDDVQINIR